MANITLKDVNGNNIYPEIDASTLSGTITENNEKFVIGGDVYTALSEKADISSIPEMDDYTLTTDSMGRWKVARPLPAPDTGGYKTKFLQSFLQDGDYITNWYGIPGKNYDESETPSKHEITSTEFTNKKIKMIFQLDDDTRKVSRVKMIGDIYGFRGIDNTDPAHPGVIDLDSTQISYINIYLGDAYGEELTDEPIMRHIDNSQLTLTDRNESTGSSSQALFHFSHFGSCSSNMKINTSIAKRLVIEIKLANTTTLKAGDYIQLFVSWTEF